MRKHGPKKSLKNDGPGIHSDTEFHRFFSIFGIPGRGQIGKKSKQNHAQIHAFFSMQKNSEKAEFVQLTGDIVQLSAQTGAMRGVCGR